MPTSANEIITASRRNAIPSGVVLLCAPSDKLRIEAENQLDLMAYISEFTDEPDSNVFSINTLRHLNHITLDGIHECAGAVRQAGEEVHVSQATFTPTPSSDVHAALRDLMNDVHRFLEGPFDRAEAEYACARVFHQLLCIHPFLEGNGRTARGYLHLMLWKTGLLTKPEEIIDYIETQRHDYYRVLTAADGGDLQPLQALMAEGINDARFQTWVDDIMAGPLAGAIRKRLTADERQLLSPRKRRYHTDRKSLRRRMSALQAKLDSILAALE